MIEVTDLTKRFGAVTAVDHLSFTVDAGTVTGFLGPNGAGKTTTLRMLLGLVAPTSGRATFDGQLFADLADPARTVGAALESSSFHPGRTALDQLRVLCLAAHLDQRRAGDVLALVGLAEVAGRRIHTYSTGMRQRLALAAALLGDPQVLLLDEPANGLDPEGIAWLRGLLRHMADSGRTVLVSSHLLAEVAQTVDQVVILNKGRLVRAGSLDDLVASSVVHVIARSPGIEALAARLADGIDGQRPSDIRRLGEDTLAVEGVPMAMVGRAALQARVELHELREEHTDLEDVFLALTAGEGP